MAEIIDSWEVFDIALTSTPSTTPPTTTTPTQPGQSIRNLAPGDYNLVVTKSQYGTVTATIRVSSSGVVSCVSGPCGGSRIPRVNIENNAVRVFMREIGDTSTVGQDTPGGAPGISTGIPPSTGSGGLCGWITGLGGWRVIEWDNVLTIYDSFLDPTTYPAGFVVKWDDILTVYDYFLDKPSGTPTHGNAGASGCNFT